MTKAMVVRKGVLRRSALDVQPHPHEKIIHRPASRGHGQYIVDSIVESNREALERKYLANRLRPR